MTQPDSEQTRSLGQLGAVQHRPRLETAAKARVRAGRQPWDLVQWALAGAVLVQAWRVQDLFPVLARVQIPSIVTLVAAVAFVLRGGVNVLWARRRQPIIRWVLVILALMMWSAPFSLSLGLSGRFILEDHSKTVLVFLLVAASIRSFSDVERFAVVQALGAALYAVMVLLLFPVDARSGRLGRLVYYDANDLGMVLVCMLPLLVYSLRSGGRWRVRLLALAVTGLLMMVIVRTGSRGAFLGLIAVCAYLLLTFRGLRLVVRLGWLVAAGLALLVAAGPKYWSMMSTIKEPTSDYNWNLPAGRIPVWKRGIGYMLGRPLTGVGANAFSRAEGTISPLTYLQDYGIGMKWSTAHNSFVQIGAELGVPGLLAFAMLLFTVFRSLWRIGRPPPWARRAAQDEQVMAQALTASMLGFVVAGFFLSQAYSAFMYSMYGMVAGFSVVAHLNRGRREAGTVAVAAHRAARRR